ncbi:hypothetical protein KKI95_18095 [Xenorhabdus bovienii]|uniref:hypothetical protein n=1 Tax=Xenorhabdus bovienii TaxID=40576 RepID=UPI00237D2AB0|nr:hypothetical protein [Xenorhabdus bovienii]MDE1484730.1 hypothetical protein [Xenorhabdus bovienii]MDE9432782.1 hypothetical protein [Xenorhabdus bovienii]MDE9437790.1 hypothetical protein [Xenorhabdus bovienii]MDE9443877.1 hypothetical protein [Xenorhabdus bovienii]MDE9490558.1 hypothetical protein [Xenorhabdus bovienii]
MATWRELLEHEMKAHNENLLLIESNTLTKEQMDIEFDSGYGAENGLPFTVWSQQRIYFPCCYDGNEWVGSVSRHPDGNPTEHIGG